MVLFSTLIPTEFLDVPPEVYSTGQQQNPVQALKDDDSDVAGTTGMVTSIYGMCHKHHIVY